MSDCLICNDIKRNSQDSTSGLTYRGHSQDIIRGLTPTTNRVHFINPLASLPGYVAYFQIMPGYQADKRQYGDKGDFS